jgi:hypothetical protein
MAIESEADVVAAFVNWLEQEGWRVSTEVDWADVVAERGSERLVAEAKGRTSEPGLEVDTLYGQLLRRMAPGDRTQYAVVVPEALVPVAERVHLFVRRLLDVAVYGVSSDGTVVPQ